MRRVKAERRQEIARGLDTEAEVLERREHAEVQGDRDGEPSFSPRRIRGSARSRCPSSQSTVDDAKMSGKKTPVPLRVEGVARAEKEEDPAPSAPAPVSHDAGKTAPKNLAYARVLNSTGGLETRKRTTYAKPRSLMLKRLVVGLLEGGLSGCSWRSSSLGLSLSVGHALDRLRGERPGRRADGLVAGKPIWAKGAKTEATIKADHGSVHRDRHDVRDSASGSRT